MMERGDKYYLAVCNRSGMIAIYNPSKNLFMSPISDGPVQFVGSVDGTTTNIRNVTRFGRDFSVVCIPYSFKLLIQELMIMNIQLRLITDDNINQMENMGYSKNIETLLSKTGATAETIIQIVKQALKGSGDAVEGETDPLAEIASTAFSALSAATATVVEGIEGGNARIPKFTDNMGLDMGELDTESYEDEDNPALLGDNTDFVVGDSVFLHGDSKPNREWSIIAIGVRFSTIRTLDGEGIEKEMDMTRVVRSDEIYLPITPVMGGWGAGGMGAIPGSNGSDMAAPLNASEYSPIPSPAIVFSPTIRVVNGADHSQNTETTPSFPPVIPNVDSGMGMGANISSATPIIVKKASFAGLDDISDAPAIDFGRLQVSKLG